MGKGEEAKLVGRESTPVEPIQPPVRPYRGFPFPAPYRTLGALPAQIRPENRFPHSKCILARPVRTAGVSPAGTLLRVTAHPLAAEALEAYRFQS
jgi:hypothetical protein